MVKPNPTSKKSAAPAAGDKPKKRKVPRQRANTAANIQLQIDELHRQAAALAKVEGRPSAYEPEFGPRATGLCMLGYTNAQLAAAFGVSEKTIEDWITQVPVFRKCVHDGREGADTKVIGALHKAACGYEHEEDDIRTVSLGNNAGSEIVITPTIKRYPPNFQAAALILANRHRTRFSHMPSGSYSGAGDESSKTKEEIAAEIRAAVDATWATTSDDSAGEAS